MLTLTVRKNNILTITHGSETMTIKIGKTCGKFKVYIDAPRTFVVLRDDAKKIYDRSENDDQDPSARITAS